MMTGTSLMPLEVDRYIEYRYTARQSQECFIVAEGHQNIEWNCIAVYL